jgi:hypothetical protein
MPYLTPDSIPEDTVCFQLEIPNDVAWIAIVKGALSELIKAYRFEQFGALTPEQTALRFLDMYDNFALLGECGDTMSPCCYDNVQYRLTSTGQIEQSVNGGAWQASTNDPRYAVPVLPPPVIDATHTKCDAAANAIDNMKDVVSQYANNLENGSTLAYMVGTILTIIFLFLDVTIIGALLTPLLIEIAAALILLNRADFEAYFTADVWHQVLCALYCSTADDGTLSQSGFNQFIGRLEADMDDGVGKSIFINSMKVAALNTVNNWMRIGESASADCSDCSCTTFCDYSAWVVHGGRGTILEQTTDHITVEAVQLGSSWWVDIQSDDVNSCCCYINTDVVEGLFAPPTSTWWNPCTFAFDVDDNLNFSTVPLGQQINRIGLACPVSSSPTGFTVRIYSAGDCV